MRLEGSENGRVVELPPFRWGNRACEDRRIWVFKFFFFFATN